MFDSEYWENLKERNDLARSARAEVGRGPVMQHQITRAEYEANCGPVKTYKLNVPMKWDTFRNMPENLQREYLSKLREKYKATDNMLAKMMGVSDETVRILRTKLGIPAFSKQVRQKAGENIAWKAFLNGEAAVPEKPKIPDPAANPVANPAEDIPRTPTAQEEAAEPPTVEQEVKALESSISDAMLASLKQTRDELAASVEKLRAEAERSKKAMAAFKEANEARNEAQNEVPTGAQKCEKHTGAEIAEHTDAEITEGMITSRGKCGSVLDRLAQIIGNGSVEVTIEWKPIQE